MEFIANKRSMKKKYYSRRPDRFLKIKSTFFLTIQSKKMPVFCVTLCIALIMMVAVLIVYFTAAKPRAICEHKFKRTMSSSLISSSHPRSVALGDINKDHQIDFVVANSATNSIGIFIAQGNGTFANQQPYSTGSGSSPRSVTIRDFNNDNYLDIIVANYYINSIGLFLGYGNGTFQEQKIIPLGSSHPLFVTTADFNKDNQMDIAVVNNGTNTISILLGYGNGSFHDEINYSTDYDSLPCSLAVGDFNHDTHLDIVVTNNGTDNIGIFLNHGNGTFKNQQIYTTSSGSEPSSVAVGDFNNDNLLDIVVANYGNGSVGIFFGYGNGTFLSQILYMIGSNAHPQYVIVIDMDKDNHLDIVVVDSQNDQIHILPGYGNGSFATIVTYDDISGSLPVCISVSDFNNDTQSDAIVANYGGNNVIVLMDYFTKPSARQMNYHVAQSGILTSVAASDFNNDGIIDIVFNPANYISILMGLGNSTFDNQSTYTISDESIPQYICTADLNNDNRTDIIVADIGLDGIDVFLGYGNGSFGTVTTYSTGAGSGPWWVTFGDLNDDNILDIVSANTGTNSIGILYGYGNGAFAPVVTYSVGSGHTPYSVAVDDINNDNYLDIVVVRINYTFIIFFGPEYKPFTFAATHSTLIDFDPTSIFLADLNRDGRLDIVIANTFRDSIDVFLGYGNGTFAEQTNLPTGPGSQPYIVIVRDVNNDNISDITATLWGNDEVVIFYGYENASFQRARDYPTGSGSQPFGIVIVDLDNNKHLEFVVALSGTGDIAILSEYDAAKFVNGTQYSTGAAPHLTSVAVGDFNNDNRSDIVAANSGKDTLSILFASSNGTFDTEIIYHIGTDSQPQYVITCDVNNDNHIDIVSVNAESDSISVIMGYGNGSFAEQMTYSTGNDSSPSAVVAGDVNNDNRLDLVVANKGTNDIGILFGYDYTSFQSQKPYENIDGLAPRGITVSDFNNDTILDIATVFYNSDNWCIFFGYGNGSFSIAKTYSLPDDSYPWGIDTGDFNNDNQSDIVIANYGPNNIGVVLGYGNGSFSTIRLFSTGYDSKPKAVACGNFNNDNRLDIVVANYGGDNIGVFLGYGNGTFASIITYSTGQGSIPSAVTIADFNHDNRSDIAVVNSGSNNVGILLGYGNGTFSHQVTISSGYTSRPLWIIVGDFDRDNELDIATANYNGNNVGILYGYGNGSFASVIPYSTGKGSQPRSISIGDFNNDNISDISVANYGTNNIVVLFGLEDGSFLLGSPYSTGIASLPWPLANGDFNQDGRLDIAVANSKSNSIGIFLGDNSHPFGSIRTYSTGDGSQPHSVALGDFNNDGWLDIVIANYGTKSVGILFGLSNRKYSDIQVTPIKNNSAPYSVSVAYINTDIHLDIVVTHSETDSIDILLGDGTGQFTRAPAHSTGFRSRPYQVTINDFNNDNISDIAIANSGTHDILFLYGYGNGTFGNDTSYPFGYGYQPYSTAIGDLNNDGWMDIAIACYGSDHVETLIKKC